MDDKQCVAYAITEQIVLNGLEQRVYQQRTIVIQQTETYTYEKQPVIIAVKDTPKDTFRNLTPRRYYSQALCRSIINAILFFPLFILWGLAFYLAIKSREAHKRGFYSFSETKSSLANKINTACTITGNNLLIYYLAILK